MSKLNRVVYGTITLDLIKSISNEETLETLGEKFNSFCVNGIKLEITDIENKVHKFSNIRGNGGISDWEINWENIMEKNDR